MGRLPKQLNISLLPGHRAHAHGRFWCSRLLLWWRVIYSENAFCCSINLAGRPLSPLEIQSESSPVPQEWANRWRGGLWLPFTAARTYENSCPQPPDDVQTSNQQCCTARRKSASPTSHRLKMFSRGSGPGEWLCQVNNFLNNISLIWTSSYHFDWSLNLTSNMKQTFWEWI